MDEWVNDVKIRTVTGKPPVRGGRSKKLDAVGFDDLVFLPAQLAARPVDYFREKIRAETVIGANAKRPLRLGTPIMVAAMSFGALSPEAKIALAKASRIAGTCTNTGEGGMLPEERENAEKLIVQYSTGRFGVSDAYLEASDAVEIKIGQGAKPGQGGLLPAEKVTQQIAEIRGVPIGKAVHSPAAHPDIRNVEELGERVELLREKTGGKPIIIKLGAGRVAEDVALAVGAAPDAIAIDGLAGGTGAAPMVMLDSFGIPTIPAIVQARKTLDELGAKQELLAGGGINTGIDAAKALALGADAVFMGFPTLVAMGCVYCKQCHAGRCPVGITTQDETLRKKLPDDAAEKAARFIAACTEEIKMAAGAAGKDDVHRLSRDDLRSLSLLMREVSGVRLV